MFYINETNPCNDSGYVSYNKFVISDNNIDNSF